MHCTAYIYIFYTKLAITKFNCAISNLLQISILTKLVLTLAVRECDRRTHKTVESKDNISVILRELDLVKKFYKRPNLKNFKFKLKLQFWWFHLNFY